LILKQYKEPGIVVFKNTYRDFGNLVPFGKSACIVNDVGGSTVVNLSISSCINSVAFSLSNVNKSKSILYNINVLSQSKKKNTSKNQNQKKKDSYK